MTWFGVEGEALAATLGLPQVAAVTQVGSTMDAAHELAALGAPAGTLVVAEEQTAGRGRGGRAWQSGRARGIWMTLIERPRGVDGLDVLSLRAGLRLAPVVERWTDGPVRLKWPNDLYVGDRKLGGILIEARWRGDRADWVAVGFGVNLVPPDHAPGLPSAAGLGDADVQVVLAEIIPALRAAAFATGPLTEPELAAFAERDLAAGRAVSLPGRGTARGISPGGELLVESLGTVARYRAGSLVFADRREHHPTLPEVPPHAARR
jgi:BirA family biotin operon repressor/biotin-[acetyl-CoA-carboxylase] ligase